MGASCRGLLGLRRTGACSTPQLHRPRVCQGNRPPPSSFCFSRPQRNDHLGTAAFFKSCQVVKLTSCLRRPCAPVCLSRSPSPILRSWPLASCSPELVAFEGPSAYPTGVGGCPKGSQPSRAGPWLVLLLGSVQLWPGGMLGRWRARWLVALACCCRALHAADALQRAARAVVCTCDNPLPMPTLLPTVTPLLPASQCPAYSFPARRLPCCLLLSLVAVASACLVNSP